MGWQTSRTHIMHRRKTSDPVLIQRDGFKWSFQFGCHCDFELNRWIDYRFPPLHNRGRGPRRWCEHCSGVALDSAVSPKSLAVVGYLVLNLVRLHRLKYNKSFLLTWDRAMAERIGSSTSTLPARKRRKRWPDRFRKCSWYCNKSGWASC